MKYACLCELTSYIDYDEDNSVDYLNDYNDYVSLVHSRLVDITAFFYAPMVKAILTMFHFNWVSM